MKTFVSACLALLLFATIGTPAPARAEIPSVETTAQAFMTAYAAGDWPTVERLLSKRDLHVYGSDSAEIMVGVDAVHALFVADHRLWAGTSSFGAMTDVSVIRSDSLASVFFNAPFSVGGRTLPLRVATVWRLEDGGWKLVQLSNTVPTTGQSAAALAK